jgi:hypothetical protein
MMNCLLLASNFLPSFTSPSLSFSAPYSFFSNLHLLPLMFQHYSNFSLQKLLFLLTRVSSTVLIICFLLPSSQGANLHQDLHLSVYSSSCLSCSSFKTALTSTPIGLLHLVPKISTLLNQLHFYFSTTHLTSFKHSIETVVLALHLSHHHPALS